VISDSLSGKYHDAGCRHLGVERQGDVNDVGTGIAEDGYSLGEASGECWVLSARVLVEALHSDLERGQLSG
jgi:hypothetical protein